MKKRVRIEETFGRGWLTRAEFFTEHDARNCLKKIKEIEPFNTSLRIVRILED